MLGTKSSTRTLQLPSNLIHFFLQTIFKFETVLDDGIVLLASEWATKIDYLAPGLTDSDEWLALLEVSEIPYFGGHYAYKSQQVPLPDLFDLTNILEVTVKEVTDFDTFDLSQEIFQETYLDAHTSIQTDYDNALIPPRNFRLNMNGYEDLEAIVAVGVDVLADPEAAQIHNDDFNLVVKTIVTQYQ